GHGVVFGEVLAPSLLALVLPALRDGVAEEDEVHAPAGLAVRADLGELGLMAWQPPVHGPGLLQALGRDRLQAVIRTSRRRLAALVEAQVGNLHFAAARAFKHEW